MLATFFESISWPMEPPPAYGAFHILFTLIGFAVCGFSAWKLRNVSDKTAGRILFACGLLLSLSEVYKQFSEWFGWYVNTPIYIFAVCLGAYLLFVLIYWLHNKELPIRRKQLASKV